MASITPVLPRFFRWVFLILTIVCGVAAALVTIAILINPQIPAGFHFGPKIVDILGQPGSVTLRSVGGDYDFKLSALKGSLVFFVAKAGGLLDILKRYGLPVVLLNLLFFAVLFDLLRRLFRNVGRGESFSPLTVRLVQYVGGWLILFSLVSAFAEHWFAQAAFAWLSDHTVVTISGTQVHLPSPHPRILPHVHGPFGSPVFFSGLLVLALSEVFRQGLVLKTENDLTV